MITSTANTEHSASTPHSYNDIQGNLVANLSPPDHTIIQVIIILTICSTGLLLNTCQFVVVLRSSILKVSTGIHLAFLSIYDNLVLITHLLYIFSHIFPLNNLICKVVYVGISLAPALSTCVLVTMTVDRTNILINPYRPKPSQRGALIINVISSLVLIVLYSVSMGLITGVENMSSDKTFNRLTNNASLFNITNNDNRYDYFRVCTILPEYISYFRTIYLPIDLVLWRLISPMIVVICNVTIIIFLVRRHSVPGNASSTHVHDKRVTRVLLLVSGCFVALILPSGVYISLIPFMYKEDFSQAFAPDNLAFQMISNSILINHSVNLILYICTGRKYRQEAKAALSCLKTCPCIRAPSSDRTLNHSQLTLNDVMESNHERMSNCDVTCNTDIDQQSTL